MRSAACRVLGASGAMCVRCNAHASQFACRLRTWHRKHAARSTLHVAPLDYSDAPNPPIPQAVSTVRRRAVTADSWGKPDRNASGEPICRWCRSLVRPPRRTFCGDLCVHEWKVRSSPGYVREKIWKRDAGICQGCGFNVGKAERLWRRQKPRGFDRLARRKWRAARPHWEADHIVPVADGGGECGLENYRLLCRQCHVKVTGEWRKSRVANSLSATGSMAEAPASE